jgi:hypothetical protein
MSKQTSKVEDKDSADFGLSSSPRWGSGSQESRQTILPGGNLQNGHQNENDDKPNTQECWGSPRGDDLDSGKSASERKSQTTPFLNQSTLQMSNPYSVVIKNRNLFDTSFFIHYGFCFFWIDKTKQNLLLLLQK